MTYDPWLHGLVELLTQRSFVGGHGSLPATAARVDHRDYPLRVLLAGAGASPPASPPAVDIRGTFPFPRDQGQMSSCTAFALTAAMEALAAMPRAALSPAFLWYWERYAEGSQGRDAPCYMRDGLQVASNRGVCSDALDPYDPATFTASPSPDAEQDAGQRKLLVYARCANLAEIKTALSQGYPVVFAFALLQSSLSNDGVLTMPKAGDVPIGGHEVVACGYDDATRRVSFLNSWGAQWGKSGYGSLPYEFFEDPNFGYWPWAWDAWAIRADAAPDVQQVADAWQAQITAALAQSSDLIARSEEQRKAAQVLIDESDAILARARAGTP